MEGDGCNVLNQCNEINRCSGNDNDDKKHREIHRDEHYLRYIIFIILSQNIYTIYQEPSNVWML